MMTSQIPTVHYTPFTIKFTGDQTARAIRAPKDGQVERIIKALELKSSQVIFIIGGAAYMEESSSSDIRAVIDKGLARFAQEHKVTVIDGGTATGVMEMIGRARKQSKYTFPLVGVAPFSKVSFPGHPAGERTTALDRYHSHFVLTDGDQFGDESDMIAQLVSGISQQPPYRALGLIVNGGEVARHEAFDRANGKWKFPLLVFEGSGRLADDVASAKSSRDMQLPLSATDSAVIRHREITLLANNPNVNLFNITKGPESLRECLSTYLFGV